MLWFYESFFPVFWVFFLFYWQIKAANTKTTQRLEPAASRILRVFIFLIVIVLLSTTRIPLQPSAWNPSSRNRHFLCNLSQRTIFGG